MTTVGYRDAILISAVFVWGGSFGVSLVAVISSSLKHKGK
jgi:hypothetical protein